MQKLIKLIALQTIFCLLLSATMFAQTVNVSVTPPVDGTGACKQNQHIITFSGAANTQLRIVPSLNVTPSGTCPTTDGVAMQFVSATNAVLVSDGDSLVVSINGAGNTTITYNVLIDCHIVGGNTVNLNQQFNSNNSTNFLVDADNIYTTTGVKKPSIVLQNTSDFRATYLSNSFFTFYYRNNGDSANIKFTFLPDANGYCGQVSTDSVFFQNGLNGTLLPYDNSGTNTITLRFNDTLVIKQRVQINSCLTSCIADTAKFSWSCNYSASQASNFCNNCQQNYKYSYIVTNNDSARVDVIRLSPAKAMREFSCFNDTANAILWSYIIVNTGRGAIDSLNFDFLQWNTRNNPNDLRALMLVDSASLHISKGITSNCVLNTNISTRNNWLCQNLISNALHRMDVRIKNFGVNDTIFLSFKTMRCSEENDTTLLNVPKRYNQWGFNNFRAREICGNWVNQDVTSGLIGTAISGQSVNSNSDDFNLKLNYFPSVSNLSVDKSGIGDSATLSIDLKGLVKNTATNVYQLLGCDTTIGKCDTLYGWLRATVFCDTNIRITNPQLDVSLIKINSNNDTAWFNHEDYYTYLPVYDSICRRNFYYYYFNLADSAMKNVLDSGKFFFKIQACCGSDLSPSPYSVTFHLLPNPNNCFTLTPSNNDTLPPTVNNIKGVIQWLPLSDKQNDIAVLCPGCLSPGIISNFYLMQRAQQSMGLQDSDNDGRADTSLTQITDTSAWYAQYGANVKRNFSGFGDRVEDFLRANFVDGDASGGIGYNYAQLQAHDLRFNVLQLSRFIPFGVDTMNLTPDSLIFYIDDTVNTTNGCIDCDDFNMPLDSNTTILRLNVGPADLNKFFVGSSITAEELRFAFTSFLSGSTLSGNLHDYPALITHTNNTFSGYMPTQNYRLRVFYSVCGNFSGNGSLEVTDYVKESKVFNRLFLSGNIKQVVSDLIPQQPNTVALLDSAGWTLDTNDIANILVDTNFMNQYFFMCEATGAIHYFVSTEASNGTQTFNNQGCQKVLSIRSSSNIAGGKGIYDAFPYEYKTPLLMPVSFNINVPNGYYVSTAAATNTIYFPFNNTPTSTSDTVTLHLSDTTGNFTLTNADLPVLHCFTQSQTQQGKDSLFFGDQYVNRGIDLYLMPVPELCIDSMTPVPIDTTCIIGYNIQAPSCLGSGQCSIGSTIYDGNHQPNASIGVNPDLVLDNINNSFALLNSDTICWTGITIQNLNLPDPATRADNIFIALIDSSPPFLSDWHFVKNGQPILPNDNVFGIANFLNKGATVTGDLCARVASCPNDTLQKDVLVHFGWNCGGFPNPYDSTTICEYTPLHLSFKKASTSFFSNQKFYDYPYVLCDTLRVYAPFQSNELGFIYPDSVLLPNLNPNLQIVGANIYNGNPSNNAQLIPSASNSVWYISPDSLISINILEGGINNSSSFFVEFLFIPTCAFANSVILPDFDVYAHDFCGNPDTANADFSNSPPFQMDTTQSACPDCWSITKTANTDTVVAISGNITYTIQVCNNSSTTQTATVTDTPPNGFVQSSSTLISPVTLASMQCSTFTVTGHFTNPTNCIYNVASVKSPANTTWKDSVCVTVLNTCSNTDTTFADSTFSSPSTSGTTTINGKSILIAGRYYVNNTLNLIGCTVYTAAGAQIIVQSTGVLNQNNTTIQSCDTMWRGVSVTRGKIYLTNASIIKDANMGIYAENNSTVSISSNSKVYDCVTGFFVPPLTNSLNNITVSISNATFAMQATAFKPDYIGQPAHGTLPRAGIEVYGMPALTIGGGVNTLNTFSRLNNGIIAHNSVVTIKNSKFYNIAVDTIYTEPYHGAAMVGVKDENIFSVAVPKLTVMPETPSYNTVNNCYRAVYTDGSVLTASFLNLLNVYQGIFGTRTPSQQTSRVTYCKITTQTTGIFWANNPNAKIMEASSDTIIVNANAPNSNAKKGFGLGGIYMGETTYLKNVLYSANYNTIILNNAYYGIAQVLTKRGLVKGNNITINGSANPLSTTGVVLNSTLNVNTSCNTIRGAYPATGLQHKTFSITASLTERSSIRCNTTDSTVTGIYFGGLNPVTRLKGNSINRHLDGLYLNTTAAIDSQAHSGNLWNGPFSSFGATNLNLAGVASSLFLVPVGAVPPIVPSNPNTGWFIYFPGTNFNCNTVLCSQNNTISYTSEELGELIASGAFQSEDYIEESRAMAEEYLYGELREDSSLWANDSIYAAFISANEEEAIGELYEVEYNVEQALEFDSIFISLLSSIDSQTVALEDSIQYLDSLAENGTPVNDYEIIREQLVNSVSFLSQTRQNIISQQEALRDNRLQDAELINEMVVPEELPQTNTNIINEIEINFLESGDDLNVIRNNYQTILSIAQQCPYAGGQAVDKARVFIALIDATMVYFDDDICLQSGIYRQGNTLQENTFEPSQDVKLIPNPANDKLNVILESNATGVCKVTLENSISQILITEVFNCKEKIHSMDISIIPAGVYTVKVDFEESKTKIIKLVIAR